MRLAMSFLLVLLLEMLAAIGTASILVFLGVPPAVAWCLGVIFALLITTLGTLLNSEPKS